MMNNILIFLGAGVGGIFRYWISNGIYWLLGLQFPYGTLVVNASGSFLMGLLFVVILDRFAWIGPELRSLLLVGFLGGYTTFSAFSFETLNLFESGAWLSAMLNIFLNVIVCILLAWLGTIVGRQL